MKNIVSKLALAAVLAAGLATPALADVDAVASINKDKTVTVIETITIDKDVILNVDLDEDYNSAAEAMAIANITTSGNSVDRVQDTSTIGGPINGFNLRVASIDGEGGSVNDNNGVTGVNQDVGAMSNQGNLWSLALVEVGALDPSLFADAQAEVDQKSFNNSVVYFSSGEGEGQQILFTADIDDSINDNVGLTAVNQNAGNMNNQTNAVAVSAGIELGGDITEVSGASVALAEAALGQVTTDNTVTEIVDQGGSDTQKLSGIANSITGNIGITQANQSTGNMGNQGNVVAAGAAVLGL